MAATPKFSAQDAKKIEQDIVKAVEVSGADKVAAALGKTSEFVEAVLKKGLNTNAGKALSKRVQDLDNKLLQLRTPAAKPGQPSPALGELYRALGEFETTSKPPSVPDLYKKQYTSQVGDESAALQVKGGPVVPVQTRSLGRVRSYLDNQVVDPVTKAPMSSETAVVPYGPVREEPVLAKEGAAYMKRAEPGPGVSERNRTIKVSKGDESAQQAEKAAEFGLNIDLGLTPSRETMRKVGKLGLGVTAGGGALAAGYSLFGDKPLSQQPDAPSTLKASDVKDTQELVDLADKAAPTLPPEQAQKAKENAEKIKTIQDLLADVEKRKQQKVDRIELMQAIETMAHGLVTAIGAGVMLNRGSPFAVDFSKGPKVDWASQLDRLQKDFDTQTNALIKKYGIEEDMKAKQEELALKKRGLDIEEKKVAQQVTKQQAEAMAKLTTEQQKQYKDNLKSFAALKEAVQNKKPGDVQQYATILGANDATTAKLTEAMNQGMWDKILTMLGISEQPTTEQILQGLRPQKPAAPAAAPAAVTVGGKTYTRPKGMSDADWAEYVKEVGGQ